MGWKPRIRTFGTLAATAALLLTAVGPVQADQVRDAQWPLTAFHATSRVWPHATGEHVIVAVIDSGVNASHVDLTGQVLPGKDFTHGGDGRKDYDPDGHGTAMASLIAGHGHGPGDMSGVKGLAPDAKILPLAIDIGAGESAAEETAQAIRYAVDHGAEVINMSIGSAGSNPDEKAAVGYAEQHNVLLVAAVGNDHSDVTDYPAAYPGVVAVTAVDQSGQVYGDDNFGSGTVLAAPGVGVVAAANAGDDSYQKADGTSEATAYAAAEAALIRSDFPKLTAGQVINRMVKTADNPTPTTPDAHYGYGVIRPDASLTFNIAPGKAAGPLPQEASQTGVPAGSAPAGTTTSGAKTASGTPVALIAGVAGAVVVAAAIVLAITLRRRKRLAALPAPFPHEQAPYDQPGSLPSRGRQQQ